MEENDLDCSSGDYRDSRIYRHRRRNRAASVELAAAAAFRMATDDLLASAWSARAVPHSLRQAWRARFRPLQFPPPHRRALRPHDPRGAGTIPPTHARTLRLRPIHERNQGALKLSRQRPENCRIAREGREEREE